MTRKNFFQTCATMFAGFTLFSFKKEENPTLKWSDKDILNDLKVQKINRTAYRSRSQRYTEYEQMDYDAKYANLLDRLADEVVKDFKITCPNPILQKHLQDLFYNVLNFKVNGFAWTRNAAKYGDNFVYLMVSKSVGITTYRQLINANVRIKDFVTDTNKPKRIYVYDSLSLNIPNTEFNSFEIIQFSHYGHQDMLPYGTSMLEKVKTKDNGELYFEEREINRFKHSIVQGLNKIGIVHLFAQGLETDTQKFDITL